MSEDKTKKAHIQIWIGAHTGFAPMGHYLFCLGVGVKR